MNQSLPSAPSAALQTRDRYIDEVEDLACDMRSTGCALRAVADLARVSQATDLHGIRSGDLSALLDLVSGSIIDTEKKLQAAISRSRGSV
ncbi:hypothetical protein GmRootV35_42030 [Variovorax sp. V35]